jgi:phospholipase C
MRRRRIPANGPFLLMLALAIAIASGTVLLLGASAPSASATRPPIVVVVMENRSASDVVGNPNMPYLNSLIAAGTSFSNYREGSAAGPSLPDYLQLAAGSSCGATTDAVSAGKFGSAQGCPTTLWNQLEAAGASWGVFMDAMDVACSGRTSYANHALDTPYALKHNPATPFASIWGDQALCRAHVLPFSALPATLPAVSFVAPGICNDQHGSGSTSYSSCRPKTSALDARGDSWLLANVAPLIASGADVFITYDEKGTLYAVGVGPSFAAGVVDARSLTHYSLLAGIEDALGLSRLGAAAGATPIGV